MAKRLKQVSKQSQQGKKESKKTIKGIAKSSEDNKQRKSAKANDRQVLKANVSFFPSKSSFPHHILQVQGKKKKRPKAKNSSRDSFKPTNEVNIAVEQQRAVQLTQLVEVYLILVFIYVSKPNSWNQRIDLINFIEKFNF